MPRHRAFQVTALYIKLETIAVEVRLSEYELSHQRKISVIFRQNDGDDFATENFKKWLFLLKVAILVYAVFLFMSKPFVSFADSDDLQRFLTRTECFCQEKLVAKKSTLCYTVLKIIAKVGII